MVSWNFDKLQFSCVLVVNAKGNCYHNKISRSILDIYIFIFCSYFHLVVLLYECNHMNSFVSFSSRNVVSEIQLQFSLLCLLIFLLIFALNEYIILYLSILLMRFARVITKFEYYKYTKNIIVHTYWRTCTEDLHIYLGEKFLDDRTCLS